MMRAEQGESVRPKQVIAKFVLLCTAFLLSATASGAVFKCATTHGIIYQSTACLEGGESALAPPLEATTGARQPQLPRDKVSVAQKELDEQRRRDAENAAFLAEQRALFAKQHPPQPDSPKASPDIATAPPPITPSVIRPIVLPTPTTALVRVAPMTNALATASPTRASRLDTVLAPIGWLLLWFVYLVYACRRLGAAANDDAPISLASQVNFGFRTVIDSFRNLPSAVVENISDGLTAKQIVGAACAAVVVIGAFCPIASIPIIGSISYFRNGALDAWVLLAFAVSGGLFVLGDDFPAANVAAWGAALTALAFGVMMYWRLREINSDMTDHASSALAQGITRIVSTNAFHLQWGCGVLAIALVAFVLTTLQTRVTFVHT
jgi:hypothetical protein